MSEWTTTDSRSLIVGYLRAHPGGHKPKAIAEAVNLNPATVRKTCTRMAADGVVLVGPGGDYSIPVEANAVPEPSKDAVRSDPSDDVDPLLSIPEVAVRLGTGPRFPRRLIEERRIEFVRVGRFVRIKASVLNAYIKASTVQPVDPKAA